MEGLNIEAYDADSLRKMVRLLEYENKILKDKLKKAGIYYEEVNPFEEKIESAEEYDLDQGNRICKVRNLCSFFVIIKIKYNKSACTI